MRLLTALLVLLVLVVAAFLMLKSWQRPTSRFATKVQGWSTVVLRYLAWPSVMAERAVIVVPVGLLLIAASWMYLFTLWEDARTVSLAVAGFFQVSDASAYAQCSNAILDADSFGVALPDVAVGYVSVGWCLRRPIYSSFLATLFAATDREWQSTLLLQAALVSLALLVFWRATNRATGLASSLVALVLTFKFAMAHAFPLSMTENAGLAFGAIGMALMVDGARLQSWQRLLPGIACMSIALNARAGAFLVLPCLLLWILTLPGANFFAHAKSLGLAVMACGMGFLLQWILVRGYGGDPAHSQSNFSYVLYGLSVGGKGWTQVLADHPDLLASGKSDAEVGSAIFRLALGNLSASPSVFVDALWRNLLTYLRAPLFDRPEASLLWWAGALSIVLNFRAPLYRLVGALSIGIVLSSTVIIQDGGPRLLAATWPASAVQAGLGAKLLLDGLGCLLGTATKHLATHEDSPAPKFDLVVALLFIVAVMAPLTPLRGIAALEARSQAGCPAGEEPLVVRLGRESYMIVILPHGVRTDTQYLEVDHEKLGRGLQGHWFAEGFLMLTPPATVIQGYQIGSGGVDVLSLGATLHVVVAEDLGRFSSETVNLCVRTSESVEIAAVRHYKASFVGRLATGDTARH